MKNMFLAAVACCLSAFAQASDAVSNSTVRINYNINFTYNGERYSYPIYIGGDDDDIRRDFPQGVEAWGDRITLRYWNPYVNEWQTTSNALCLKFNCANDTAAVYYSFSGVLGWGTSSWFPTTNKVSRVGTFGPSASQTYGYDGKLYDVVVTACGDPWARVTNDCGKRITANGVQLENGESRMMVMPFQFTMGDDDEYVFYDDDSGESLADLYETYYDRSGENVILHNGNVRICLKSQPVATNALDALIYADLKGGSTTNKMLFGESGAPVYAHYVSMTTNIQLNTWWDFSSTDWGSSPKAKINDEVVCSGHSTTHIIAYTVNANNLLVNDVSGVGFVYFTMSQEPDSGKSGGNCVMRCWDSKLGSNTSGYANAPADHKAEVSAGTGVATFKLTINIYTGEWKVEPN